MKTISGSILALALGFSTLRAFAQDQGGPPPRDDSSGPPTRWREGGPENGPPRTGGPQPGGPFRPEPSLFRILDTNHDGVIDAEEIVNASLVLARLAKQNGGELRVEDFMGRPPRGERGGPGWPPGQPPMPDGREGGPAPDRYAPPAGGPDRQFDGPRVPRRHRWNRRDEMRRPEEDGPRGGIDQGYDGPRGPQRPMDDGANDHRGPHRSGPPPSNRRENGDVRPGAGPGPRPDISNQPRPDPARPPRPDGPGPGNGDNRPGQPPFPATNGTPVPPLPPGQPGAPSQPPPAPGN